MEAKTFTTKFRYRIEPKPGGGFIARAEDGPAESLEGATREEVQQKLDDKLTGLVGEVLHDDKLTKMVGEMLHHPQELRSGEFNLGGAQIKVNVTSNFSTTKRLSQAENPSTEDLGISASSTPHFESSNKLWLVIALSVALGAVLMYLLKR